MLKLKTPEYAYIPDNILDSLRMYIENKIPTGGFLQACLENNLYLAVCKADLESSKNLKIIISFINNELPSTSHGSPKAVKDFLKSKKSYKMPSIY